MTDCSLLSTYHPFITYQSTLLGLISSINHLSLIHPCKRDVFNVACAARSACASLLQSAAMRRIVALLRSDEGVDLVGTVCGFIES